MDGNDPQGAGALPPHAELVQMGLGYGVSRIQYAAAELALADHLAAGPRNAADLAAATADWPRYDRAGKASVRDFREGAA